MEPVIAVIDHLQAAADSCQARPAGAARAATVLAQAAVVGVGQVTQAEGSLERTRWLLMPAWN